MSEFETTYHTHYRQLIGIASKMIDDPNDVQDIVQEVFVSYYEKSVLTQQAILNPRNWLIRATLNKCIDHLKRGKKHVKLEVAILTEQPQEETVELKKQQQILRQAIKEFPPREIELLILYSKGFSYKEISEITGINYTSLGKTLSRTLQKLKLILKRMNYEMY